VPAHRRRRPARPGERFAGRGERLAGPAGRSGDRIRKATASDVGALGALMTASPLLRRYGTTAASSAAALRRGLRAGDVILVAGPPAGPPRGLAWLVAGRALARSAYLRLLLVADNAQGSGLGARLLAAGEARLRPAANHLVLLVTRGNAGARRFYRRHGYRRVGLMPEMARPGLDEVLYWKPLRPFRRRLPA
jgi:ribosomal protein S18 acetylase RimI-like enzyme